MQHQSFEFDCRGVTLYGQSWLPGHAKAHIIIVHGMGEHSGRYANSLVPEFLKMGSGVWSFDHFGHGRSRGRRGVCPGYDAVVQSVEMMVERVKLHDPDSPVFLYGHSMGGNAVLGYGLQWPVPVSGIISSSPMLATAFDPPAWKLAMGRILGKLFPALTLPSGLDPDHISRIEAEVDSYRNDPLVHDRVSPNFVFPFFAMAEQMLRRASEFQCPVLLFHGTGDKITAFDATKRLAAGIPQAEFIAFEEGYHELHHDLEQGRLIQHLENWFSSHIR